ncbi:hypothetical protein FORC81_2310 [Escherichia coli]|nr:hypothetical protein FORC81_2310 [Escherichia coli]
MFGVSPAALVAHTGLAGEERLKAFPLQIFQDGDGGNVRIPFTAGGVPVFRKNTRDVVLKWFTKFGHLMKGDILTTTQNR